ncbi:PqqD family protein [Microbacterium sp. E-13]|uniref:PqqD family protein n=1 Tax=Microbacterium sp. E-13 TaxID=3404048 RepID=UPI003CEBF10C
MAEHLLSERMIRVGHPEWRIREDVSWTSQTGRIVALELSNAGASPVILDGSAAAIWQILNDLGSAAEPTISQEVIARFHANRKDVERPLADFLARLEAARLIELEVRFTP